MTSWTKIADQKPPETAMVAYYVEPAGYILASGKEFERVIAEWPDTTHWIVLHEAPTKDNYADTSLPIQPSV